MSITGANGIPSSSELDARRPAPSCPRCAPARSVRARAGTSVTSKCTSDNAGTASHVLCASVAPRRTMRVTRFLKAAGACLTRARALSAASSTYQRSITPLAGNRSSEPACTGPRPRGRGRPCRWCRCRASRDRPAARGDRRAAPVARRARAPARARRRPARRRLGVRRGRPSRHERRRARSPGAPGRPRASRLKLSALDGGDFRARRPGVRAQWERGCSSSLGLRRVIGCFFVLCSKKNAIVPHTAGTQSEIAW